MKKNKNNSNIVAQLTCAALALPGLTQTVSAGRVEETYNFDFQYGNYQEGGGRMGVDIFDGIVTTPVGKSMTASVNLTRDSIAGASPIYNTRDATGRIHQVISGASKAALKSECGKSICEQRDAASAGLTYFFDKASISFGGGYSREHDYDAKFFNTTASIDLNKKLTTLNFGASVSFDEINPTFTTWTNRPADFRAYKTSQQYLLGITQIIDKNSLILSNITFAQHDGFLTDPYKQATFNGNLDSGNGTIAPVTNFNISERRPRERFQWAWLTQYVRHFDTFNNAALHADYRFSTDSWGVNSHTVELSWHQPIADGWMIVPRFRYYSQDKADFYKPVFDGDIVFDSNFFGSAKNLAAYSSDYRLAGFGTLSGGLKLSKEITHLKPFSQLKFQAAFEYFSHKTEYQLGGNNLGTFSDFGYYLITTSFNLKF